ncbi:MAG TPA: hypothetical protein PLG27_07875, partial [Candidatus Latescibacteria bacterium]|nr:hypothetical protein [Candidatus Latescibacterota bacterium]
DAQKHHEGENLPAKFPSAIRHACSPSNQNYRCSDSPSRYTGSYPNKTFTREIFCVSVHLYQSNNRAAFRIPVIFLLI